MEGGNEYKKGLWTEEEDRILMEYIRVNGKGKWNRVNKVTGLKRCGKSCRLRWMNYLSPNVKRGDFSEEEEDLIIRLHNLLGNRWSLIAGRVPGRTDNQVKNHWNTHLSKKLGASSKKGKTKKPKTSSLQTLISKEQVKEHFCVPSESNSEQSELQPLPKSINSNSNINGDEEAAAASASASFGDNVMMNDNIGSISAVGLSSMWEAMMGNNNYDSSSSFWFYNDDLNLYSSYLMDPSVDDHYPLPFEDGL